MIAAAAEEYGPEASSSGEALPCWRRARPAAERPEVRLKADTTYEATIENIMARYTMVYGVRLVPEGTLKDFKDASLTLADGTSAGVTLHTIDGTIPQLRRAMDRSLDAFFDLLPGADEEDLEKFGD